MLTVVIPTDPKQINKLIQALEWQLQEDTSSKDIQIHKLALKKLKGALHHGKKSK